MASRGGRVIIRSSRKGYIPYYFMIFVVIVLLFYIRYSGLRLERNMIIASVIFMVFILKLTEVDRFSHHYEISPTCLEKVEGIIFKRYKRMNYGSISQLHFTQNPWQKMLDIGSVEIAQFSETIRTEIKNINKPQEFIEAVSQMMHHKGVYKGDYTG